MRWTLWDSSIFLSTGYKHPFQGLKGAMMICYLTTAALLLVYCVEAGDVCQTYAGGAVYPRETGKSSGHSLQWTKAMSNFVF